MVSKKAQGIIEFIVIFGAIFFFFVIFLSIIQYNIREKNIEKEQVIAMNLALSVRDEISLANGASEGYYREFTLPQTILGKDYTIGIVDGRVFISGEKIGMSYQVTSVTGNVQKGINVIKKENGEVLLN